MESDNMVELEVMAGTDWPGLSAPRVFIDPRSGLCMT